MKRPLLCLVATLCTVSLVHADETIRSWQQTLKDQGVYYGPITGDKSAETTAAIRRYQIRNGLQVTGDLNEKTMRALNSVPKSVVGAARSNSKPAVYQPSIDHPDVTDRVAQTQHEPP